MWSQLSSKKDHLQTTFWHKTCEEMIEVLSSNNRCIFLPFNFDDFGGRKIQILCCYQISTLIAF